MISIDLGTIEYYDEQTNEFVYEDCGVVDFEYSLKVVYDWEFKWRKPFLKGDLNEEELMDFYHMMATKPISRDALTYDVIKKLYNYIKDPSTATTFKSSQNGNKSSSKGKIYTAEEIYALMAMQNVPLEFENRNLNRLMAILRIISVYNEPDKKMSKADIYKQNAQLNAERKRMLKSKG